MAAAEVAAAAAAAASGVVTYLHALCLSQTVDVSPLVTIDYRTSNVRTILVQKFLSVSAGQTPGSSQRLATIEFTTHSTTAVRVLRVNRYDEVRTNAVFTGFSISGVKRAH